MATRRNSRQAARRRRSTAHTHSANSLYRRRLRYEPLEDRRLLALVTVTTLADTIDFNDGLTSLREAIFATNLVAGPDTIDFAPALTAAGPATILLTQGELNISDQLTISGPGANLLTLNAQEQSRVFNIASSVDGAALVGLKLTSGNSSSRGGAILSTMSQELAVQECVITGNHATGIGGGIYARGPVTLEHSTVDQNSALDHGGGIASLSSVTLNGSTVSNNAAFGGYGGGIWLQANSGRVTLTNSTVSGNSTAGSHTPGGGIFLRSTTGTVTIDDSQINGNSTQGNDSYGGGISLMMTTGTLNVTNSTISGNWTADYGSYGGGVAVKATTLHASITDTTVHGNYTLGQAAYGGGLSFRTTSGSLTLTDSTISNNATTGSEADGGGIWFRSTIGDLTLQNTTISGNSINGNLSNGGGVWTSTGGIASIEHSTIADNHSSRGQGGGIWHRGRLNSSHSIIAVNSAQLGGNDVFSRFSTVIARYSLLGDNSDNPLAEAPIASPDANGNLIGGPVHGVIDPLLGPLADNGGPTLTHALLPGSPAINAGDLNAVAGAGDVPLFDQRGEPFDRVFNGRIDIGAFEYEEPSDLNLLVDTLADESDGDYSRGDLSLREAIALANLWPSDDTIRFDPALTATGPATILLTMGELAITDDVSIIGLGADLLTIDASGNDPTPDLNNGDGSSIFNIDDGNNSLQMDVAINSLTLTGGDRLSGPGAIYSSESLAIDSAMINGNSSGRSGGGVDAILFGAASLTITDSVVSNNAARFFGGGIRVHVVSAGSVEIFDNHISHNTSAQDGGGILIESTPLGHVMIHRNTVDFNSATNRGGGIYLFRGTFIVDQNLITGNSTLRNGGGIYLSTTASALLSDNEVSDNSVNLSGGGIYIPSSSTGNVTIARNTVSHNTSAAHAGGIRTGGTSEIIDSVVANNSAESGGGGILAFGATTIRGSTISGNLANEGGGIRARGPTVVLNSTISGNGAETAGGGVWAEVAAGESASSIVHSTITNNGSRLGGGIFLSEGDLAVDHSIVANNSGLFGPDLTGLIGASFLTESSLIGNSSHSGLTPAPVVAPDANGSLIGGTTVASQINPMLGPLADNGGPTLTHALLAGSPAINAGDPSAVAGVGGVPVNDQRGAPFTRVYGGRIDIGAFEAQPTEFVLGDFNRDGTVDAADFLVWRREMGTTTTPGTGADANGDGFVDYADHALWRSNFGQTSAGQGATQWVPGVEQGVAGDVSAMIVNAGRPKADGGILADRVSPVELRSASRASSSSLAQSRSVGARLSATAFSGQAERYDDIFSVRFSPRVVSDAADRAPARRHLERDFAASEAVEAAPDLAAALDSVFATLGAAESK